MKHNVNHRNLLMTALFLFALGLSLWLMQQSFFSAEEVNTSQPTTPDVFMTDINYTHFNEQGQWSSHIQADRITHYPDQDTSKLEKPKMISRANQQLTWIIHADHGTAQHGLEILYLMDNVQVERKNADKTTLTLNTTQLVTYPQQKFAQTDQPVTIIQPGNVVHATGLTANMNTGDIYLLSRVQGAYEKSAS